MTSYTAPNLPDGNVTPILVRDELLKCFESANREFSYALHQPSSESAVRVQVQQFVTDVFQRCGVSFDNPTKAGILTAMGQCRDNAEKMMGEAGTDIIAHHYSEMVKLVEKLPDR